MLPKLSTSAYTYATIDIAFWFYKGFFRGADTGQLLWIGLFFVLLISAGMLILFIAVMNLRSALSESDTLSDTAASSDLEKNRRVETILASREREQEDLFRRNLKDTFILQSFELRNVRFFDDRIYRFQPRVNVLLGKNGYGKTLLLRALAALIQNDLTYSGQLFAQQRNVASTQPGGSESQLKVEVTRNGETEETIRDALYFQKTTGKIPLLAIPDSRFVDRAQLTVGPSVTGHEPLSRSGARNFLTQETYGDVIRELLAQLSIDYLEGGSYLRGKRFDQPIFRLIEYVVRNLTGDDEFAFHEIRREGRTGFKIMVRTTGSSDETLPIQHASQGTLSILAMFGLIYSFLRSLNPDAREDELLAKPGIVIIDEIDAHLHPSWQQKIVGMLCDRFPNLQFIVTAHSPLIVAGCDWGEAAVLRRNKETGRFYVETLERDFIGATARELYDLIFEIEDIDQTYLQYATKSTLGSDKERDREVQGLEDKRQRTAEEERRLNRLLREDRLIDRAGKVREERLRDEQTRIEDLEAEIRQLKRRP